MTNRSNVLVYIREQIPEEYITKLNNLGIQIVVEPWVNGHPEPEPGIDLSNCDIILTTGLFDNLSILKKAPNVKWIHSFSVGIDAFLHRDIRNSNLLITNSKGCTSIPVAEHTLAMMLALARGVPAMVRNQNSGIWSNIVVKELSEAVVGIIGYGQIGYEISRRCKCLGMYVMGCRKHPEKSMDPQDAAEVIVGMDRVEEVIAHSDFLVLSLPSTEETFHFMNKGKLSKMKAGSFLVNVGRGSVIAEADLVESLRNGPLAGAALDVFEEEPLPPHHDLWSCENVIISPHKAYDSPKNVKRHMDLFMHNLECFLGGKPLRNVVDKQIGY